MAPNWLRSAARAIPWAKLLEQAPAIIEGASRARRSAPGGEAHDLSAAAPDQAFAEVERVLKELEETQQANAELVARIARQLEAVTQSSVVLAARVRLLTWALVVTFVVALAALAGALWG